jgi:hypothetical protein
MEMKDWHAHFDSETFPTFGHGQAEIYFLEDDRVQDSVLLIRNSTYSYYYEGAFADIGLKISTGLQLNPSGHFFKI